MLGYIYRQQLGQLLNAKRILLTLFGALAIGGLCLVYLNARGNAAPVEHTYVRLSEAIIIRIAALVCAIYTMNVVSAEIQQKTIVYLVTVPVKRSVMFLGRVLAAGTASALASILFVLITGLVAFKSQAFGAAAPMLLRDSAAIGLGAFAYCGIYAVFSLLLNHALLYSLLFAFGWETLVPNMPGDLYKGSILRHIISAAQHPEIPRAPNGVTGTIQRAFDTTFYINPTTSIIVLLAIPIVTFAFGAFWFERNEYVPREDYE